MDGASFCCGNGGTSRRRQRLPWSEGRADSRLVCQYLKGPPRLPDSQTAQTVRCAPYGRPAAQRGDSGALFSPVPEAAKGSAEEFGPSDGVARERSGHRRQGTRAVD